MNAFSVFIATMAGLGCFGLGLWAGVTVEARRSERRVGAALEWMRTEQRRIVQSLSRTDPRRRLS